MAEPHESEELLRFDEQLAKLCDDDFSPADAAELERIVTSNSEALWRYIQAMYLYAGLRWAKGGLSLGSMQEEDEAHCDLRHSFDSTAANVNAPMVSARRSSRHRLFALVGALLLAVTGAWWIGSDLHRFGVEVAESIDKPLAHSMSVAQVIKVSSDCECAVAGETLVQGQKFAEGRQIRISRGQVHVRFRQGAQVVLNGPAAFIASTGNSGQLILGGLTAEVPEGARGFSVHTPRGKVVDLGTEFGVVVDDFGSAEVGVFEGKVVAYGRNSADSVELNAGDAWLLGSQIGSQTAVAPERFGRGPLFSSFLDDETPFVDLILKDDFNDQVLDTDKWKVLGHVIEKNGGLQLGLDEGEKERGNVPYLLTVEQFDPAQGTLVITGTVAFSEPMHLCSGSLSVLTRAQDQRGTFPRPEYSYLGTGVRSTFWPVSTVAGETLRMLVRPLPESENVGILGEDFEASGDASRWRFQVVDDGVNLMLCIAQIDDPSITKSVRGRSLFRGKSNFIALEGDPNAAIAVDDVRIFQLRKDSRQ